MRITLGRHAAMLAVMSAAAGAADLRIDHATVAGTNLENVRRAFSDATGIPTDYGGPHSNHATEMALASFPDGSYLELMGIQGNADPAAVAAQPWAKFLRANAGPCASALRVPDVSAETARLKAAGIPVGEAERSGRARPDGVQLSWEAASVGPGPRGSLFPFLIRDFSPREKRVNPEGHPTTTRFTGIAKVVIGVGDLDGAIEQYRRAFGLARPRLERDDGFGADLAWFEGTPIVLARGIDKDTWLSKRVSRFGDAPCAFILGTSGGLLGQEPSTWFGRPVFWANEARLGWRLGMEIRRD